MAIPRTLTIVLAGGEGKRLMPLTSERAKPAVPFGGNYRLIDFALSNVVNSELHQVVVLTQYKSHSLDLHISQTWRLSNLLGQYVTPVPAQQRVGKHWYLGSADAIFQSLNLVSDERPDVVVVVGADHVYRMDFSQMIEQHIESGAACSVAAIRQPISESQHFGVIQTAADNPNRITEFLEKPENPTGMPNSPGEILASMGNYVFNADALVDAVRADANAETSHDMGGDIVPWFVNKGQADVYDFTNNQVPGSTDRDAHYWRDVGTLDSYYEAHMDMVSVTPEFNLYNDRWTIHSNLPSLPPAKFIHGWHGRVGHAINSLVSPGVVVSGGLVEGSVVSPGVRVHSWAQISDSVLLDGVEVGRNATIRRAIIDKGVVVPEGADIGVDADKDRERGFHVTDSGITVLGKGQVIES